VPREGILVEQRSTRARVYPSVELASPVGAAFEHARVWPPVGLPAGYAVLLAEGLTAFARAGERLVAHGGIALEEVVVPWVRIEAVA
jgi:hypothetical protein